MEDPDWEHRPNQSPCIWRVHNTTWFGPHPETLGNKSNQCIEQLGSSRVNPIFPGKLSMTMRFLLSQKVVLGFRGGVERVET